MSAVEFRKARGRAPGLGEDRQVRQRAANVSADGTSQAGSRCAMGHARRNKRPARLFNRENLRHVAQAARLASGLVH